MDESSILRRVSNGAYSIHHQIVLTFYLTLSVFLWVVFVCIGYLEMLCRMLCFVIGGVLNILFVEYMEWQVNVWDM